MKILCSMPGRFGDALWSLPTARAIAESHGGKVDFVVSKKYGSIASIIGEQPYIGRAFAHHAWDVQESAPMTPVACPPVAGGQYTHVIDLGYRGWPNQSLPWSIYHAARARTDGVHYMPLDLDRPWIEPRLPASLERPWVAVGFSEEWLELKAGIVFALAYRFPAVQFQWIRPWGKSRYDEYGSTGQGLPKNVAMVQADWLQTVTAFSHSQVFLGCLSSSWVLANALNMRTVIVEPNSQRHHPIFWLQHERNRLVLGNDGQPTFDARHVGDALQDALYAPN